LLLPVSVAVAFITLKSVAVAVATLHLAKEINYFGPSILAPEA
jgi:hypothetical protein